MKINRVGRLPPLIAIFQGLLSSKEPLVSLGPEAIFGQERVLKYPDKYQKPDKCRVAFPIYINYDGFSSDRGKDHAAQNDAYMPTC